MATPPTQHDDFQTVLRDYSPVAYRMAFRITGGRDAEAQDLAQEVMVKMWARWKSYRPDSIKSWMYRVLKNLYIDNVRHRVRHPAVSLEEDIFLDQMPSAHSTLEKEETHKKIHQALNQLDEQFRAPVIMCDIEGMPYDQIAKRMNCPVGTVRSRIHRGRSQLRRLLPALGVALAVIAWICAHFLATQTPVISPRPLEAHHPLKPVTIALHPEAALSKDTQ